MNEAYIDQRIGQEEAEESLPNICIHCGEIVLDSDLDYVQGEPIHSCCVKAFGGGSNN